MENNENVHRDIATTIVEKEPSYKFAHFKTKCQFQSHLIIKLIQLKIVRIKTGTYVYGAFKKKTIDWQYFDLFACEEFVQFFLSPSITMAERKITTTKYRASKIY